MRLPLPPLTSSREGFLLQGQFSFENDATYSADELESFFLNGVRISGSSLPALLASLTSHSFCT